MALICSKYDTVLHLNVLLVSTLVSATAPVNSDGLSPVDDPRTSISDNLPGRHLSYKSVPTLHWSLAQAAYCLRASLKAYVFDSSPVGPQPSTGPMYSIIMLGRRVHLLLGLLLLQLLPTSSDGAGPNYTPSLSHRQWSSAHRKLQCEPHPPTQLGCERTLLAMYCAFHQSNCPCSCCQGQQSLVLYGGGRGGRNCFAAPGDGARDQTGSTQLHSDSPWPSSKQETVATPLQFSPRAATSGPAV